MKNQMRRLVKPLVETTTKPLSASNLFPTGGVSRHTFSSTVISRKPIDIIETKGKAFSSKIILGSSNRFFSSAPNYTAEISNRMNKLKEVFKFQNKITQSKLMGAALVEESKLFCELILACSTQNGLSKTQRDLCVPYVRMYSGAPVDGSADNSSTKAQLAVIFEGYPDSKKKTTLDEIKAIGIALDKLFKGSEESAILKRSALYIAVQLIALDKPFSEEDKKWVIAAANSLGINQKEEQALTELSVLDHKYTPFGPKPTLSKAVYEEVIARLDDIEKQINSLYLPSHQFTQSMT